jgi:hypothetical protein
VPIDVIVSIDRDDSDAEADLKGLAEVMGADEPPVEELPLDAAQVVSLLVEISTATWPFFQSWVDARVKARREFKVVLDGVELTGYTAREAQQLLQTVKQRFDDDPAERK